MSGETGNSLSRHACMCVCVRGWSTGTLPSMCTTAHIPPWAVVRAKCAPLSLGRLTQNMTSAHQPQPRCKMNNHAFLSVGIVIVVIKTKKSNKLQTPCLAVGNGFCPCCRFSPVLRSPCYKTPELCNM
jgi:hypothetical protein